MLIGDADADRIIGGADRNYYRLDGSDDADVGPDDNVVGGDTEPPTITITSPAAGEAYLQYDSIMIDYTCEDDADVVECAGDLPVGSLLDTSVPGDHAFTITASDEFGNTSSSTVSYRVVYQFSGFQEPVGDGLSAAQAGRTIPLTWTLNSVVTLFEFR